MGIWLSLRRITIQILGVKGLRKHRPKVTLFMFFTCSSVFQSTATILSVHNPPSFFSISFLDVESKNSFDLLYQCRAILGKFKSIKLLKQKKSVESEYKGLGIEPRHQFSYFGSHKFTGVRLWLITFLRIINNYYYNYKWYM